MTTICNGCGEECDLKPGGGADEGVCDQCFKQISANCETEKHYKNRNQAWDVKEE